MSIQASDSCGKARALSRRLGNMRFTRLLRWRQEVNRMASRCSAIMPCRARYTRRASRPPQLEPHLGILEPAGAGGGQDQQPERPDRQLAAAVVTGGRWRALAQLHRLLAKICPAWDEGSQPGMALGKREPHARRRLIRAMAR